MTTDTNEGREQILTAARTIVAKQGEDALSVRGIASECGISSARLYRFFASKNEIIEILHQEGLVRCCDQIVEALCLRLGCQPHEILARVDGLMNGHPKP